MQIKKDYTREQIVEIAKRVFLKNGYAKTSMRDNDQLHAILGYDFFHADSGMFAVYKKNSELWVKLKYSF